MKISKEVRIGILVSLSILIFFIGFNFLKNATVFSTDKEYYCFYSNVAGLQNSANVQIRGLNVGHVSGLQLIDGKGVKVTVTVSKTIELPVGTVAKLESALLATPTISLELGSGPGVVPPGGELISYIEGGVVDNLSSELTPRLKELRATIIAFDSVLGGVNAIVGVENQKTITEAIRSVKATADNLAALSGALKQEGGEISAILHNANNITGNLARSNDTITHLLSHVNNVARHLDDAPIEKTVQEIHGTMAHLNDVIEKIDKGQGTLGLLINNKDMYNNLNNSLSSLNALMADIKAHPSRYINVNLVGGKKKD